MDKEDLKITKCDPEDVHEHCEECGKCIDCGDCECEE